MIGIQKPIEEKLLDRTAAAEGCCIVFTGYVRPSGYATVQHQGRKQLVHRVSYEHFIGPIPAGLTVDHLCRVRHCINPNHLEAVTQRVNTLRGSSPAAAQARQTHCIHGHAFTPANTRVIKGKRHCKKCDARRRREYVARQAQREQVAA